MSLNLGLEDLQPAAPAPVEDKQIKFDLVAMLTAETELNEAMEEFRESRDNLSNLIMVVKTVKKHGSYTGFESLIADKQLLDKIAGCDICNADAASIEAIVSSEAFRESVNKLLVKVDNAISKVTDKIGNFVRTTLPFKEKYLKEMVAAKEKIAGRKFDEEKFANQVVASALPKDKFKSIINDRKKMFDALMTACKKTNAATVDSFLAAVDNMEGVIRTSVFGTLWWKPYYSWFRKAKVKDLGYTIADVPGVLDDAIKEIKNVAELNTWGAKASEQYNRLRTEIRQLRATGKKEEAISKRDEYNHLVHFVFQLWEGALTYEGVIRREMYFATYLARALMKSEKTAE